MISAIMVMHGGCTEMMVGISVVIVVAVVVVVVVVAAVVVVVVPRTNQEC